MRPVSIIVAVDEDGGFSKDGKIPWDLPADLNLFKKTTMGKSCIMGRLTYEDILQRQKDEPEELLPGRQSYVISSNTELNPKGATLATSLRNAREVVGDKVDIVVIGGRRLYIEALAIAHTVHMTIVRDQHSCDMFFPIEYIDKEFQIYDGKKSSKMYNMIYKRKMYKQI